MVLTLVLSLIGCISLFLAIWGLTVTLPTNLLVKNFPVDVQDCLKPRLENLPMSFKRVIGWIILIGFCILFIGLFIVGGVDGIKNGYTFLEFFLRFFIIGALIKVFDIVCLDYILLTKTQFFQHYFPETKNCIGWKQFGYNRKQQLRQCIAIPVGCLFGALIFSFF
ncbi:MAG: hypothetical protein Q4C15_02965 [Eubacteriales bacterium]|nr:hypothetical protein [Eubacteriales bacterium]